MTLPTIRGTSWVLMRNGDPVPVQNFGHIPRAYAMERAEKYVEATPGAYKLVRVEHIEREAERIALSNPDSAPMSADGGGGA